jgi:2-amino-4-hydroxy-6-hydroxymethyldihydropteridine diphosphokinase
MNRAFLLIGGNLGERAAFLAEAREQINRHCGHIVKASALYETAAWGKTDQRDFLNQALEVETDLPAEQLITEVLLVEKKMGRVRMVKYGERTIDIDILLFNDETHNTPLLKIPHPEMQNRRFVLKPLAEIAPNAVHPVLGKTVRELLDQCPDPLAVNKFEE